MSSSNVNEAIRRDIDGKGRTLSELFIGRRYAVDTYQREYKWQNKQLVELLADLWGKFQDFYEPEHERTEVAKYGHYFLGSIILSQKKSQSYIIDGQQRLTTLTLLLIYLNHLQRGLPDDDRVEISHLILSKMFGKKSFNIDVPERSQCLEKLYLGEPYHPTDREPEAVRNMVARYNDIEQNFPDELRESVLPYFLDWLLNNVHIVEITAYSDDDAYTIFETMNDRGLSLAPLDMLKSFLISNITDESERDRVNSVWKQANNRLLELGKEEPTDAVKSWLRSQYAETIRERKKGAVPGDFDRLGTEPHRWVAANQKQIGLDKSADYVRLIEKDFKFFTDQYEMLLKASRAQLPGLETVRALSWLGFTLQYPLLLAPQMPNDDETTRVRKYRVVASYLDILIARRIWNFQSIVYSTLQYSMFLVMRDIRGKTVDQLVTILKKRLADENKVFNTNPNLRMHQQNRFLLKWLLARMTDYVESRGDMDSRFEVYMSSKGKSSYEVEHIWADHWEDHKEEFSHKADFDEYRNRFGGLLLLPKSFNASYGDLPYVDEVNLEKGKLQHYLKHNLLARSLNPVAYSNDPPLTKLIQYGLPFIGHETFKKKDIETRQSLYVAIAQQLWNPERLERDAQ